MFYLYILFKYYIFCNFFCICFVCCYCFGFLGVFFYFFWWEMNLMVRYSNVIDFGGYNFCEFIFFINKFLLVENM